MIVILAVSVAAMLLLEAAPPWGHKDLLLGAAWLSTVLAVIAYQSWKFGAVRWIVNLLAAAFGAFFFVPAMYWGMRLADPIAFLGVSSQTFNYVVAAVGAGVLVFLSWLPIRTIDLFRRH